MTESEAREALIKITRKYLKNFPDIERLISIIKDESRPGLPVRGVLEDMKKHRTEDYSNKDREIIEELIYLYG